MTPDLQSAEAVVEAAHERVNGVNPEVNAVLSKIASYDDAANHLSDNLPLRSQALLVKDCIDIAGYPTSHGSEIYHGSEPKQHDAEVVRRVKAAGMVIVGKAHLTEFCFGATGENAYYGDCRNPWDLERITGGSSSGSAAAVAAGITRYAIGTDTGGSVRVPASLCGVVGLRPTLGRVSNRGVLDVSTICDTVGPLAPTVAEVAQLFGAMAGYDPADPLSIPDDGVDPLARIGVPLNGLRIAVPHSFFGENLQEEVANAVDDAVRVLEGLGAKIVRIGLSNTEALQAHSTFRFVLADVADARRDLMARYADRIGPEVRRRIELGQQVSGQDYASCIRVLWRWKAELRSIFSDHADVMLTPTCPVTAPLWKDSRDMVESTRLVARMTYDLGASGVPSMSVPCGFDRKGLPIGMQLSAAWGREDLLFQVGAAYQEKVDFHQQHPAKFAHLFG